MSIHSQNIEQKPNSDSIKGLNSVANLRKIMLYNSSYDLVNDNMYKKKLVKFVSLNSQGIEQNPF